MDGTPLLLAPLLLAVTAVAAIGGLSAPAWAPAPTADAVARLAAQRPQPALRRVVVAEDERRCLALNVYWESRGEPESGKVAVAYVTLNRVGAAAFPATICGVVRQGGAEGPCQFGWYCDGRPDAPTEPTAWADALAAADHALAGAPDPTGGALYFHGLKERPQWAQTRYGRKVTIGQHVFFTVRSQEQVAAQR